MSIIIAIVIIGVILLFTIGSHASYSFYGGTRLVLDSNDISKLTNE
jgi:RsiW-degrading membrane proteinase PrsW (M82 family)